MIAGEHWSQKAHAKKENRDIKRMACKRCRNKKGFNPVKDL